MELVAQLAQEGGVHFQHFLVSKVISPNAEDSSPKEWTYRDLLKLPKERLKAVVLNSFLNMPREYL